MTDAGKVEIMSNVVCPYDGFTMRTQITGTKALQNATRTQAIATVECPFCGHERLQNDYSCLLTRLSVFGKRYAEKTPMRSKEKE
jgi:hypothetical protein